MESISIINIFLKSRRFICQLLYDRLRWQGAYWISKSLDVKNLYLEIRCQHAVELKNSYKQFKM